MNKLFVFALCTTILDKFILWDFEGNWIHVCYPPCSDQVCSVRGTTAVVCTCISWIKNFSAVKTFVIYIFTWLYFCQYDHSTINNLLHLYVKQEFRQFNFRRWKWWPKNFLWQKLPDLQYMKLHTCICVFWCLHCKSTQVM